MKGFNDGPKKFKGKVEERIEAIHAGGLLLGLRQDGSEIRVTETETGNLALFGIGDGWGTTRSYDQIDCYNSATDTYTKKGGMTND